MKTASPRLLAAVAWLALLDCAPAATPDGVGDISLAPTPPRLGAPPEERPVVSLAQQQEIPTLPETTVIGEPVPSDTPTINAPPANNYLSELMSIGRGQSLLGETGSASQGRVGQSQLQYRPLLRPGEVFETIPGVIVTQHSGSGKANQWFLRGFNLDHGTDFSIKVDNIPINLPTHAHGQGYLDVNFLIPELIESMDYKKGPYYAEQGDFSSAGGAEVRIMNRLPQSINRAGVGSFGYFRSLNAASGDVGRGTLLYAFEYQHYDGPWVVPEGFNKYNGLLKYTLGDDDTGMSLSTQSYYGEWVSTDQIPRRAVDQDIISRYGAIDPTDGGRSTRIINNAQAWHTWNNGSVTRMNVYAQYYRMDLFNNFTYFLDDPVNGDQFAQRDKRAIVGTNLSHEWEGEVQGRRTFTVLGTQIRDDSIPEVGLQKTAQRNVLSITRDDRVNQASAGLFGSRTTWWYDDLRTVLGTRGDFYNFDVDSRTDPANSGFVANGIWSPKASIVFGPWDRTEYFVNWGFGFHSNDARGTTITVDPNTGLPVTAVTPLVRSQGYEAGFRSNFFPNLNTQFAFWNLDLASELLFVGDAGTTEPSRPSRRYGVEISNFYKVNDWLQFDCDVAATQARFTGEDPAGPYIPGSIGTTVNTGPTVFFANGAYISGRLRHFGPRPLIEDNSVRSIGTSLFDLRFGYEQPRYQCGLDIFNLLGTTNHDIDYFYTSRLPGEPAAGIDDVHFHPVEKFGVRGWVNVMW